jgi:hypothetical protein
MPVALLNTLPLRLFPSATQWMYCKCPLALWSSETPIHLLEKPLAQFFTAMPT